MIVTCDDFYYLKWITEDTRFPIKFKHRTNNTDVYKWFKYYDKKLIDDLDKNIFEIDVDKDDHLNILKIYKYDATSHYELDHYKLLYKPDNEIEMADDQNIELTADNEIDEIREVSYDVFVYTIAYLKKMQMVIHESKEFLNTTCLATLILPLGINEEHTQYIQHHIEDLIDLKLTFLDDDGNEIDSDRFKENEKRKKRFTSIKRTKRDLLDRYIMELEFRMAPITFYRIDQDNDRTENVTCVATFINYDGSKTVKQLYKTVVQQDINFTINIKYYRFNCLLVILLNIFINYFL